MFTPLDVVVSTTLARVAREAYRYIGTGANSGAAAGQSFEREAFRALAATYTWEHCIGPDHFDLALDLVGRTGTHYEFDGAFLTRNTLYVIEAKKVRMLTRQHVGIYVHKLLDILLAARDHVANLAIKPVLVSAGPTVSHSAWLHAAAWGVLLISPQRPTPLEIRAKLDALPESSSLDDLRSDCEQLAHRLWRPIDRLIYPSKPGSLLYHILTDQILDRDTCQQLMDLWEYCVVRAPAAVSPIP